MILQDLIKRIPKCVTVEIFDLQTSTILFKGAVATFEKMCDSDIDEVSAYCDNLLTHEVFQTYPRLNDGDYWLRIDIEFNA